MSATGVLPVGAGARSRSAERGQGTLLGISEVQALLQAEFPDISISKLRFLEAEGLVQPRRAPSGYRKYTDADVERLRFVLSAQRDRYLPLRVIRGLLESGETPPQSGPPPPPREPEVRRPRKAKPAPPPRPEPAASQPPEPEPSPARADPAVVDPPVADPTKELPAVRIPALSARDTRLSRAELLERSGLDASALDDLERYGLVTPLPGPAYGLEALTIASVAARLAPYGLTGRHLRPYRTTADREIGLLAQLLPGLVCQNGPEQARQTVSELAGYCARLHGALLRQGLARLLGP